MKTTPLFIKTLKDNKNNKHTVFIFKNGEVRYGNKIFANLKEVKNEIKNIGIRK